MATGQYNTIPIPASLPIFDGTFIADISLGTTRKGCCRSEMILLHGRGVFEHPLADWPAHRVPAWLACSYTDPRFLQLDDAHAVLIWPQANAAACCCWITSARSPPAYAECQQSHEASLPLPLFPLLTSPVPHNIPVTHEGFLCNSKPPCRASTMLYLHNSQGQRLYSKASCGHADCFRRHART